MNSAGFYEHLPSVTRFTAVADLANYRAMPDDWYVATTDVASSTQAVEQGRYKLVNTAGASGISAAANALGHHCDFPFVFGGDGAAFAVHRSDRQSAADALAAVRTWAGEELDLDLRAAIVPVRDLRRKGKDVLVARYKPSADVSYAMFAGGGVGLAEQLMKQGENAIAPAAPGSRPDLTGLSCRWQPMKAQNGLIVSIVVASYPGRDNDREFMDLVGEILALAEAGSGRHSPVPPQGPLLTWPPRGLAIEVAAKAVGMARVRVGIEVLAEQLIGWVSDRTGHSFGRFNAGRYRREVAANSDFRKFDDGLKLTLDVSQPDLERLTLRLERAEASGHCMFGLHKQHNALMTCIVPSAVTSDHIHFIDGAEGGYVCAASMLKAKLGRLGSSRA